MSRVWGAATYGDGETDNEHAGGSNHGTTGSGVGAGVGVIRVAIGVQGEGTQGGEDEEPREHPETTDHHGDTTTELLTDVQTTEGREDVDGTQDHGGDVRVGDADGVKDLRAVVEEEVGAGELLQSLKGHADGDTAKHGRGSEDLIPLGRAAGLLGLEVLADVVKGVLNLGVALGDTRDESKGLGGLGLSTAAELPAGGLAHDEHANGHDGGGNETNAHGDAPGRGRLDALSAEVDTVGDEDTESDEQLVRGDQGATDLARGRLGLVHGRQDRECTDAEAVNETTDDDLVPVVLRGDADDVADDVDEVPEGDAVLAAEPVRDGSRDEGTDQTPDAEHTGHQTLPHVAELEATGAHLVTEALPEVVHLRITGDRTTFPSEDETAEGDKEAHDEHPEVEDLRGGIVAVIVSGGGLLIVAIWWC